MRFEPYIKAVTASKSVDEDMYKSIDLVINKIDRQVIKYKEKFRDHHQSDGSIKHEPSD